jgi:hypothetical protein
MLHLLWFGVVLAPLLLLHDNASRSGGLSLRAWDIVHCAFWFVHSA